MTVLVDTCVLVPAFNPLAKDHRTVRNALVHLTSQGKRLATTPQNLAELWNVCTRPVVNNGRGLVRSQAQKMIRIVLRMSELHCESAAALEKWMELVDRYDVRGVAVHDVRLVGVMLTSGISTILTYNVQDFQRFIGEGIDVVTPNTVDAASP